MRLAWSDEDEAFRAELVGFLDEHAPPEARDWQWRVEDGDGGGFTIPGWARRWQATLFDHGWMIPGYPPELGGRDATPVQTLIYLEELATRGIPRSLHFPGYAIVAPSLLEYGDEAQKALAPAAVRGDTVWCIGMSEPDAGSDLAGLQTRAVKDGDRFVVNGQKVWTSYAQVAQKCFCYVRTDPDAPKHQGISVLVIDMDTPGIDIRPLRHISGAAEFAEVFFTDVVVPAANLVGELNDGWRITTGSLAHERGGLWIQNVARAQHTVDELLAIARRTGQDGDAGVRRSIAAAYEKAATIRALGYKGFASFAQGGAAPEHSYMKLATSELVKSMFEQGMELLGGWGAATSDERGDAGRWSHRFFTSFAGTIAGGTSEIQRNIIAQRVLGLPGGRDVDFTLTPDQELLRDSARALLAKECPPSLVRAHAEDPSAADTLWKHLSEWLDLAGGDLVDLCLFLEETGAVLAPGPFFATAALFRPLCGGDDTGTVAVAGPDGEWPFGGAPVSDAPVRTFVLEADRADRVAVVVPGPAVVLVDDPVLRPIGTVDSSRRVFEVDVPAGAAAAAEPLDPSALADVLERAAVALAAEMVGTARWILDATVAYAKERIQFDRPIGSFQAVQHKLADMALDLQRAEAAVYYAAMTIDAADPDRHRAAHVAKAAAGTAVRHCAKDGIQLHGGIGYTWEHDLHLYIRRAYGSEHLLGTTERHHDRLAALLFEGGD